MHLDGQHAESFLAFYQNNDTPDQQRRNTTGEALGSDANTYVDDTSQGQASRRKSSMNMHARRMSTPGSGSARCPVGRDESIHLRRERATAESNLRPGAPVKIMKAGHQYGRVARVVDPMWHGMVKVEVDGKTKSYVIDHIEILGTIPEPDLASSGDEETEREGDDRAKKQQAEKVGNGSSTTGEDAAPSQTSTTTSCCSAEGNADGPGPRMPSSPGNVPVAAAKAQAAHLTEAIGSAPPDLYDPLSMAQELLDSNPFDAWSFDVLALDERSGGHALTITTLVTHPSVALPLILTADLNQFRLVALLRLAPSLSIPGPHQCANLASSIHLYCTRPFLSNMTSLEPSGFLRPC